MDILTFHLGTLILTGLVVLYADHMGFRYFTGRSQTLDPKKVRWAHRLVFIGLFILIITGVMLTLPSWAVWFENPFFYAKLAFVATLLVNGIFIDRLMQKATIMPYALLSAPERRLLMVSGALSATGWVASVLIGFFGL
ncbi:MAG: hypothetical protein QG633_462 [Patescibacteria group bacterium]|jgi:uncharacterized membrane protein|nr:hypothetical protein [Patescibacteria group bacterium]